MRDKERPKILKTLHWWMLTLFSVMDKKRIEIKDIDPETAEKMQHFINEFGGRIGYAELKALDLKALKLLKHVGAPFLISWFWSLKGKALDKEYTALKERTWVLGQYEFDRKQWAILFELVYKCEENFVTFWPDEQRKFFGHINDCNMDLHYRVNIEDNNTKGAVL